MQSDFIKVLTEDTVEIITDETLREMKSHGTAAFPFQYYSEHFDWNRLESIEWHWHTEMEFVEIQSGAIECNIGEQKIHLQKGDALFINSGVIHRYQPPKGWEQSQCRFSDILFSPELIGTRNSAIYRKYVQPIITNGESSLILKQEYPWEHGIIECYERIVEICQSNLDMPELRIQRDISDLWLQLVEHVEMKDTEQANSKNVLNQARLRMMMQFIWDHYTERISLEDIAGAANISKSAALRCFRTGMQMSPVGYLNDYRLNRAKDLLISAHGTISEVAMSVGFDNVGYFDRVFKRAFGMTPKQFARQEIML